MDKALKAQILKTAAVEPTEAVSQLRQQLAIREVSGLLFFCSSSYNLKELSINLSQAFDFPIVGCTTAGEISDTMESNSIVALAFNANNFAFHHHLIEDLDDFKLSDAMKIANKIESGLKFSENYVTNKNFGFLLTDGLSKSEEKITALIYQALGGVNILGGSAADDTSEKTQVYCSGEFYSNASVFTLIEIKDSFGIFKIQHFIPTQKELITTQVDFQNRVVNEINGMPAAIAYADANGLDVNNLSQLDFATYPLMLNIADQWYIRSITSIYEDFSLQFHCAIDCGLPLSVGEGIDMVQSVEDEVSQILDTFDEIYFTLGCDCIFRKLEIAYKNYQHRIEPLLKKINFIGFNGFGEQYNGIHFNQTMVGVTVGKVKK